MDELNVMGKAISFVKKYRYVILVCLLGVALMLLPERKESIQKADQYPLEQIEVSEDLSDQLAQIIGKIRGAGKVEVMLTVSAGAQTIYQTDPKESFSADSGSDQQQTVLITSSDKNQTGLIKQILPETYLGAIVVCQGADDPAVCLAIVEAVSDVTGLSTDKISVLRMK